MLLTRVIENQKRNRRLQTTYIYEMDLNILKMDKGGQEAPFRSRTFEIVPLDGEDYHKLVKKDGKPLPATELEKEQRKLENEFRILPTGSISPFLDREQKPPLN